MILVLSSQLVVSPRRTYLLACRRPNRHSRSPAGFGRVLELTVAPFSANQRPSGGLKQPDDFPHLHLTTLPQRNGDKAPIVSRT